MAWNSRGLRGSNLEDLVNLTNESYMAKGLAIIQKIPTPITPVQLDKESHTISLAYFEKKSTVDFIGAAQGLPIAFDAKETGRESLPIQNIHDHQIAFMREFQRHKGLAFLLVSFSKHREYYLLPFVTLFAHWQTAQSGGRKSIPRASFDKRLEIFAKDGFFVHYLEAINSYFDHY